MAKLYALVSRQAWFFLLLFVTVWLELAAAAAGCLLPGPLFLSFYLGVACTWPTGLLWGMLAGGGVEIVLGRHPTCLLLLLPLQLLSHFWQRHGDRRSLLMLSVWGAGLGLVFAVFLLGGESLAATGLAVLTPGAGALALLIGSAALAAAAFPLYTLGFDYVAATTGLPRFRAREAVRHYARHDD